MNQTPLPQDIADQLKDVMNDAIRLSLKAASILDQAGIDITGATSSLPADVVDLDTYRRIRAARSA